MAREWNAEQHTFEEASAAPARQDTSAPGRERVLSTVTRLFYEEGVRTVGVDRLIAEAPVTKATFYKHFGSRANLVQEYIELLCTEDRETLAGIVESAPTPRGVIDALVELVAAQILDPGYRGSALLNAAAAHPDRDHPVRVSIEAHDASQKTVLEAVFAGAGLPDPRQLALILALIIVGAHGAATLGDRDEAVNGLREAAKGLLPA